LAVSNLGKKKNSYDDQIQFGIPTPNTNSDITNASREHPSKPSDKNQLNNRTNALPVLCEQSPDSNTSNKYSQERYSTQNEKKETQKQFNKLTEIKTKMSDIDSLPARKRKAILVMSSDERNQLEYTQGGSILYNEQIYILVPSEAENSDLAADLDNKQLLNPGNLLIQNPYDTWDYESLDDASVTFAMIKLENFITLCGKLGAKKVYVERIEVENSKGKTEFAGSLGSSVAEVKAEGAKRTLEKIERGYKADNVFEGGEPNFDEAKIIWEKNLLKDRFLGSILEQRKGGNPIKSKKIDLDLTQESNNNLQIVASLKIPSPEYINLQLKLNNLQEKFYQIKMKLEIYF
jgi:hypothetical protein